MSFKKDFIWGAAATSHQIEGAAYEDGKGLSVWDTFCKQPGKIWMNQNADVACDHYHRYKEDVALMKEIGLKAYELSVSWPRVLPAGTGEVNQKGLDFYDKLIDELVNADIIPFITIYHWDMPYELFLRGGWLNPDSPDWFADYAKLLVDKLSDRVSNWLTFNEPQCFIGYGHMRGEYAPGLKLGFADVLKAGHNALLAHGKTIQMIRANTKQPCKIGFSPVGIFSKPATDSKADIEAARKASFKITEKNCWNNTWWMDPVYLGHYPEDGLELFGKDTPDIGPDDMKIISQPLDFCGVNIYFGDTVKSTDKGKIEKVSPHIGHPIAPFDWFIDPDNLYWGPKLFFERYNLPIYITENGMPGFDWISMDGKVHDPLRIDYLNRYLLSLERVIDDGVDVHGYFHWSIMDNFELADGFKARFGLIFVDYPTQERILKDSAYYYKKVIASNGGCLTG